MLLQKIVPHLAQIIVCPQNTNCASGCVFCQNIKQNSYEDFFLLRPEKNIIKISDLDTLFDWVQYRNSSLHPKVYWISQIETMTKAASNKMLKFLETNYPNYFGILTTNNPAKLLPTIRSRLQIFSCYQNNADFYNWKTDFDLNEEEYQILFDLNPNVYFVNVEFVKKKFLPTMKLIKLFITYWTNKTLDELYLWDKTQVSDGNFWFFLELLILYFKQILWKKLTQLQVLEHQGLHWLLTFSKQVWSRHQEFILSIQNSNNEKVAFLFWVSQIIAWQKQHFKIS